VIALVIVVVSALEFDGLPCALFASDSTDWLEVDSGMSGEEEGVGGTEMKVFVN